MCWAGGGRPAEPQGPACPAPTSPSLHSPGAPLPTPRLQVLVHSIPCALLGFPWARPLPKAQSPWARSGPAGQVTRDVGAATATSSGLGGVITGPGSLLLASLLMPQPVTQGSSRRTGWGTGGSCPHPCPTWGSEQRWACSPPPEAHLWMEKLRLRNAKWLPWPQLPAHGLGVVRTGLRGQRWGRGTLRPGLEGRRSRALAEAGLLRQEERAGLSQGLRASAEGLRS